MLFSFTKPNSKIIRHRGIAWPFISLVSVETHNGAIADRYVETKLTTGLEDSF